jgi:glutamyl-tRNA reductase
MQFLILGLNHTTAPLMMREKVVFHKEALNAALVALRLALGEMNGALNEVAILSTCNRTELYIAGQFNAHSEEVIVQGGEFLAQYHQLVLDELSPHLYTFVGADAVRHTFRVASGLDSMILGEPQILGQMKEAMRSAQEASTLGTYLHQLFQRAFSVAKEVRSTTDIGMHSISLAAAAVKLSQRIFDDVKEVCILFIGAGEMIELCATHFAAQHPLSLHFANRTLERSTQLAHRFHGEVIRLSDLPTQLAQFDIVLSCTASSLPIIGLGMVERAIKARLHKPMFMIDLAVPRDIEEEVGRLDDVFLSTVDDLGAFAQAGLKNRQAAVEQAQVIIETRVDTFMYWLNDRTIVPVITELHTAVEYMRIAQVERAKKSLARGEPIDAVLENLSKNMTAKFLHGPQKVLHQAKENERVKLIALLSDLFSFNRSK